jgi:BirA family biotin operon repressor/biotin-[acetyl-CoA-carboxylase] ligase
MIAAPLSAQEIRERLTTRQIGRPIHYYSTIGSTNDEAKRLAEEGAPAGTLVIADQQTAGRGRHRRHWVAPPNACLLMSLVFRPALAPAQSARLTMLCSLSVAEAIEAETGLEVGVKWPNDLVIPNLPPGIPYRKLAGLLTETALSDDQLLFAVVGMGINVNLDPAALGPVMTPATSLQSELGRSVDRVGLLAIILQRVEERYPEVSGDGLHAEWSQKLVTLGQQVAVAAAGGQLCGLAEGVDADGALMLRDLAGNLHRITAGDVGSPGSP